MPEKKQNSLISSPCIQVCSLNSETRICSGCGRNITEIAGWANYSALERKQIMEILPNRMLEIERAIS